MAHTHLSWTQGTRKRPHGAYLHETVSHIWPFLTVFGNRSPKAPVAGCCCGVFCSGFLAFIFISQGISHQCSGTCLLLLASAKRGSVPPHLKRVPEPCRPNQLGDADSLQISANHSNHVHLYASHPNARNFPKGPQCSSLWLTATLSTLCNSSGPVTGMTISGPSHPQGAVAAISFQGQGPHQGAATGMTIQGKGPPRSIAKSPSAFYHTAGDMSPPSMMSPSAVPLELGIGNGGSGGSSYTSPRERLTGLMAEVSGTRLGRTSSTTKIPLGVLMPGDGWDTSNVK